MSNTLVERSGKNAGSSPVRLTKANAPVETAFIYITQMNSGTYASALSCGGHLCLSGAPKPLSCLLDLSRLRLDLGLGLATRRELLNV